jgi:hypothetical protein
MPTKRHNTTHSLNLFSETFKVVALNIFLFVVYSFPLLSGSSYLGVPLSSCFGAAATIDWSAIC